MLRHEGSLLVIPAAAAAAASGFLWDTDGMKGGGGTSYWHVETQSLCREGLYQDRISDLLMLNVACCRHHLVKPRPLSLKVDSVGWFVSRNKQWLKTRFL